MGAKGYPLPDSNYIYIVISNTNTMKDKRKQRRAGFYFKDEKPYLSVTEILKVIDKSNALMYWFGKNVYYAVAKDPGISEKDALAAPYRTSKKAKERGSAVHTYIENYKKGVKPFVEPDHENYYQAWLDWVNDYKPNILEQERTIFNEDEGYAGTMDMVIENAEGKWVLDLKTGKDIYPESWLQCSAYAKALKDPSIVGVGVLLLKEEGGYKFETMRDIERKYNAFLSALTLYKGLHEEKLIKMEYLK